MFVEILKLMLGRYSEDEIWSRFMFELVIWLQEVTFARWTQPSGPLCLWQCFFLKFRLLGIYDNMHDKSIENFMSRVATLMNKLSPIGTLLQKPLKVLCLSMILKYEVGILIFKCPMKQNLFKYSFESSWKILSELQLLEISAWRVSLSSLTALGSQNIESWFCSHWKSFFLSL